MGDRIKKLIERNTTHGLSKTRAYSQWAGMIKSAHKGKIVIENDLYSFENFYKVLGECPEGFFLKRKDISKNYTSDNLQWDLPQNIERPKKDSILIEFQGETHTITWWGRKFEISMETIKKRLNLNLPLEIVFSKNTLHIKQSPQIPNEKITGRPRTPTIFKVIGEEAHGLLKNGSILRVDKNDLELVNKYNWRQNDNGYVETHVTTKDGKYKRIFIHRLIAGVLDKDWRKTQVDHRDNNPLNNTRENLRICNNSQNQINRLPRKDNTSGYTGVYKEGNRWFVSINGRRLKGTFHTKEAAFEARKNIEIQMYEEFSKYFVDK